MYDLFCIHCYLSSSPSHFPCSLLISHHQAHWPRAVRAAPATLGGASPSFSRSSMTFSEQPATTRGLHLPPLLSTVLLQMLQTLQPACCWQQRSKAKQRAKHRRYRAQSASVKHQVSFNNYILYLITGGVSVCGSL